MPLNYLKRLFKRPGARPAREQAELGEPATELDYLKRLFENGARLEREPTELKLDGTHALLLTLSLPEGEEPHKALTEKPGVTGLTITRSMDHGRHVIALTVRGLNRRRRVERCLRLVKEKFEEEGG